MTEDELAAVDFQSPIHRGSKCNYDAISLNGHCGEAFSPLFIGEVNVTKDNETLYDCYALLSVPYSSGK